MSNRHHVRETSNRRLVSSLRCLIFLVFISSILALPGAPPTPFPVIRAPSNIGGNNSSSIVCSNMQFRRKILVTFQGRPGNTTDADVRLFQQSFEQTYNNVAKCGNANITFRRIVDADVLREAVISYGNSLVKSASYFVQQEFTWIVRVRGNCRGCHTNAFKLFASDPIAPIAPTPPSSPTTPNSPICNCPPPQKATFLQALNQRSLLPRSIYQVSDITVLFKLADCSPIERQFEAYLTVDYSGGNNNSATNQSAQSQLLAQSVLETYNDANALNVFGVCDTQFRTLTSIQVIAAIPNGSSNRRLGGVDDPTFKRDLIFRVKGKCRGCSKNPSLYDDGVGKRARQLGTMQQGDEEEDMGLPSNTEVLRTDELLIDQNSAALPDSHHRKLPIIDGNCYCPATTTARRTPTKSEFIQALNDRFEVIGPQGAGVVTIASAVQNIAQVVPVNCSTKVNNFVKTVLVRFSASHRISNNDLTSIGSAFQITYNFLAQQQFCDPFVRTVSSVRVNLGRRQLLNEDDRRGLQSASPIVVVLRFVVQGKCRGCSTNSTLFDSSSSRSLQVTEGGEPTDCSVVSEVPHVPKSPRMLQRAAVPTITQCFCFAKAIALTAPSVNTFQVAFNRTVNALDRSFVVGRIVETA